MVLLFSIFISIYIYIYIQMVDPKTMNENRNKGIHKRSLYSLSSLPLMIKEANNAYEDEKLAFWIEESLRNYGRLELEYDHPIKENIISGHNDPFWMSYETSDNKLIKSDENINRFFRSFGRTLISFHTIVMKIIDKHRGQKARQYIRKDIRRTLKNNHDLFISPSGDYCFDALDREMLFSGDQHFNAMQARALIEKGVQDASTIWGNY